MLFHSARLAVACVNIQPSTVQDWQWDVWIFNLLQCKTGSGMCEYSTFHSARLAVGCVDIQPSTVQDWQWHV